MRSFLKFLSRNKLYTAIEAAGLAVSLAVDGKVDFRQSGFEKGASGRPFQR